MGVPADLLDAALALPADQRDELATRLLASLGVPPGLATDSPSFEDELRRRADAMASGADPGTDWTSVKAGMRAARAHR